MKKRIYFNFLVLILSSVLFLSVLLSLFLWGASKKREMASIRNNTWLVADFYNRGTNDELSNYISTSVDGLRMTIISPDGTVLIDNSTSTVSLNNHGDRAEVMGAIKIGTGEAVRYSKTFKAETYYFAVRLHDGNVLRLSKSISSIADAFKAFLPIVIFVSAIILLFANFLARRLTEHIVRPLNHIDFDGENEAVYDELLPYVKKIAEQKREIAGTIDALKNRADTIAAITANMKEGLILLDNFGTVLTANKTVSDIFGDVEQKNILYVCRDIEFQQGVRQCLTGTNAELIFSRYGKKYNVYFSPVNDRTRMNGAIILFFDATERHRAEQQRREFSANVSHELKTPLTSISALSEMIGNGMAKEEDVKGFASKISGQAKRLIDIIDDIIRLSEFDEGKTVREYEVFDIYALTETAIDSLRANDKGVEILLHGEHFDVFANSRMVNELLYNLLDNAIKYNRDGGNVAVTLALTNRSYSIAVSDTGIGIPAEHHDRVFERFYRVDSSRSKKTGGTGLGLSIVKHIAEHHGGRVEIESAEGKGTTITCWLATRKHG